MPSGLRQFCFKQHRQDQQRKRVVRGDSPWAGGFPRRGDSQAYGRDALRDRACARMEAPGRLELSRVARGERMIASRARSDPIPLPLGSIPDPASVILFESTTTPKTCLTEVQKLGSSLPSEGSTRSPMGWWLGSFSPRTGSIYGVDINYSGDREKYQGASQGKRFLAISSGNGGA